MLIALLAVLGVDLIVIVVLAVVLITRKRWVVHQDGAFRGAIRVTSGDVDGLGSKWRRGYGRWVRDVLVWTKGPLLLRNEAMPTESLDGERTASPGQVKRLGEGPIVATLRIAGATAEVATRREDRDLLLTPYRSATTAADQLQPSLVPKA